MTIHGKSIMMMIIKTIQICKNKRYTTRIIPTILLYYHNMKEDNSFGHGDDVKCNVHVI